MLAIRNQAIFAVRNSLLLRAPAMATMSTTTSKPDLQPQSPGGPVEQSIREKVDLSALLLPSELSIANDSWQHRHHAAMRADGGGNGETRRLRPVQGKGERQSISQTTTLMRCHGGGWAQTTMQRHRMIYAALTDEFSNGLHALSLKTKTSEEVQKAETS
ncbi:SufE-like protein 1, chloroplastic/mitochondrial [Grifola frondosa]|uniref:SufE-like protein 1, chloroplastic/mitochondrial n=1 Tax=Grifola frondosa TaxID=5627 RepID=A0A1C7LT63_GRIFR|nr:SufE-like protein 1, chloroplastic/mitochondrial [Grifola frondosa]